MKLLIIKGSPRSDGNTNKLLDVFLEEYKSIHRCSISIWSQYWASDRDGIIEVTYWSATNTYNSCHDECKSSEWKYRETNSAIGIVKHVNLSMAVCSFIFWPLRYFSILQCSSNVILQLYIVILVVFLFLKWKFSEQLFFRKSIYFESSLSFRPLYCSSVNDL